MCISLGLIFFSARSAFANEVPMAWDYSNAGECVKNFKVPKPIADWPMVVQVVKDSDIQKDNYV
jgi:hypothetical protein